MTGASDPSYDDLAIFLAVCSAGGFRSAARQLGLSASKVSETVTRVETLLGVALLARTTRSVMPTEAGRELAASIAPLFSATRVALAHVAGPQNEVRGRLKLNVTGAVMVDILPPIINRFMLRYPGVRVELVVEDRLVDITAADCDAGIRYGEHLAQDMIAVPIGPRVQQCALGASPAYLGQRGEPAHPNQLSAHQSVRMRYSSGVLISWELQRDGEVITADPPSGLIVGVDAAPAAIGFACDGHGIIYTFENWLEPHFDSGALVPLLRPWWPKFEGPQLYFSSRLMAPPLRAFIDFISAE
jgi:DNA-binding transcriptional LysR family regulator